MTREEAIRELREDKALYETDNCHAGDGSPDGDLLEAIDTAIEALSARPTGEWIPCSERLPETEGDYLITFRLGYLPLEVCYFEADGWTLFEHDEVLAWMELPEPYKGE